MVIQLEDVQRLYEIITLCPYISSLYFPIYCTPLFVYTYMFLSCELYQDRTYVFPILVSQVESTMSASEQNTTYGIQSQPGAKALNCPWTFMKLSLKFEIQDWCLEED